MITNLIKKAKKGDIDAFEEVILYYKNDLYKIARTRLNKSDDIDDAIQETIITAYQSIHKLINISKFKSWLITILITKCKYIYKQKNNTISYDNIDAEKFISNYSDINSNIEFYNLLDALDNDEKTIMVLYYSEGYKTKEISKILNINDSTIRNKISRARKKLEKILKEESKNG